MCINGGVRVVVIVGIVDDNGSLVLARYIPWVEALGNLS